MAVQWHQMSTTCDQRRLTATLPPAAVRVLYVGEYFYQPASRVLIMYTRSRHSIGADFSFWVLGLTLRRGSGEMT